MGARRGADYVEALNASDRDIRIHGERVTTTADHPAFRNVVRAYAALYDLQHDPDLRDVLTYKSPTSGEPVGTSFLQPETLDDLDKRGRMMKTWADRSFGNLGRTGDYLNSAVMAMASAADWFGQVDPRFADNVRSYYEHVREHDLLLTHT
ncbi:MAG: 4-hydroxyphenylacetate 3-hydroxylase N-terminal domain-containing protein, partial [Actinomycetota bacterium]